MSDCTEMPRESRPARASLSALATRLRKALARRRSLARLDDLEDRQLRDVGLSRWDVREMRRHW